MDVLEKIDKQYIWHPFTQMQDWEKNNQLIIERGDGVYLYDTKGKKYIDGVSSLWVTVHGHRKKEIDTALKKQLGKIAHSTMLGLGNIPSIELAKRLVEITPKGLEKVFFSDSGSTAVEVALKIAFQYWQQLTPSKSPPYKGGDFQPSLSPLTRGRTRRGEHREKTGFITLANAYHGDTIGSVSVGGMDLFHKIYKPLLFKSFKCQSPHPVLDKLGRPSPLGRGKEGEGKKSLQQLENIMKKHHCEIAAMIVEPMIQAAAGMLLMPKGYMKAVEKLCRKYNILLICDEVATGFGRTGKMFACEHEGITPDIMCVAKGITGGYLPVAATLTTKKIFNAFLGKQSENKTFFHGHTYTGNPLGCAAAVANLGIFKKEKTIEKLQPKIAYLKNYLKKFKSLSCIQDVRQIGFMVGIELRSNEQEFGHKVILEARKRGVIIRPLGNVIVLVPPLGITILQLKKLLDVVYCSIAEII